MKKVTAILLTLLIVMSPMATYASSSNSVDRTVAVKEDYEFKTGNAFVKLRIEEAHANEFGPDNQSFRVELDGAEWFEDGEVGDVSDIEADIQANLSDSVSVTRVSNSKIDVTINRSNGSTDQEAYWIIPLYAVATGEGDLTVSVDGRDSSISDSNHVFATVPISGSVSIGYRYDQSNKYWLTIQEEYANQFGVADQVFRLVLTSSEWFDDDDAKLSPQDMMEDAFMSGVEDAEIKSIKRIDDKTLEVVINRGLKSNLKGQATWSIPLYHVVTESGAVSINIEPLKSRVDEGSFTKEPIKVMTVENRKVVRLQIDNTMLYEIEGAVTSEVALDVAPINPSGTTLVPLRGILEALGADVAWNGETRQVTLSKAGLDVVLTIDSDIAMVNGAEVTMTEPAQIIESRTLIPLRFVSENLGYTVDWFGDTQEIEIYE